MGPAVRGAVGGTVLARLAGRCRKRAAASSQFIVTAADHRHGATGDRAGRIATRVRRGRRRRSRRPGGWEGGGRAGRGRPTPTTERGERERTRDARGLSTGVIPSSNHGGEARRGVRGAARRRKWLDGTVEEEHRRWDAIALARPCNLRPAGPRHTRRRSRRERPRGKL